MKAGKGRIDVLFVNAGVYEFTPFGTITEDAYDRMFDINVKGTLFTVQQAVPLMAMAVRSFSLVLWPVRKVLKPARFTAPPRRPIRSFARSWTSDLKGRHIRVNVLSPGPIQTPGLDVFAIGDVEFPEVAGAIGPPWHRR